LHQQGPLGFRQFAELVFLERATTHFPRAHAVFKDQARLDFFFQRQASQFVLVDRAFEIRDGLTDQQGFLLPVVTQEFARRDAAKQLNRNIRIRV